MGVTMSLCAQKSPVAVYSRAISTY